MLNSYKFLILFINEKVEIEYDNITINETVITFWKNKNMVSTVALNEGFTFSSIEFSNKKRETLEIVDNAEKIFGILKNMKYPSLEQGQ